MKQNKDLRKNLRIGPELHQKIKILSAKLGVSMVVLISDLVDKRAEDLEKQRPQ